MYINSYDIDEGLTSLTVSASEARCTGAFVTSHLVRTVTMHTWLGIAVVNI